MWLYPAIGFNATKPNFLTDKLTLFTETSAGSMQPSEWICSNRQIANYTPTKDQALSLSRPC